MPRHTGAQCRRFQANLSNIDAPEMRCQLSEISKRFAASSLR